MLQSLSRQATEVVVLAVDIPVTVPPFAADVLSIAGWVMWAVAAALLVAGAVALGKLGWASHQGHQSDGTKHIGIIALCAIGFGALGEWLQPLIGA